jgi:hypothetical protein
MEVYVFNISPDEWQKKMSKAHPRDNPIMQPISTTYFSKNLLNMTERIITWQKGDRKMGRFYLLLLELSSLLQSRSLGRR